MQLQRNFSSQTWNNVHRLIIHNVYKYSIQGKTQLDSVKSTLSSGL